MGQLQELDGTAKEAQRRLYPSLTNPNWLVLRARRRIFERWARQLPTARLAVLDVGGRIQPYRPLIADRVGAYVAIDLVRTAQVNVIGRAESLPFADACFDLVLSTQVLQYIAEPGLVAREVARVLKPGGVFWLSVPSAYPNDAAEECWRFLPAGLRHILSPFQQVEIVAEGSSVAGFFRTANVYLHLLAHFSVMRALLKYAIFPVTNVAGACLEGISGGRNQQFAVNYSVLARK